MNVRMRTIDQAIAQLKRDDPQNCLTRNALRTMVLSGKVPYIKAGSKYLVNYDGLLDVLSGKADTTPENKHGRIRQIKERYL